MGGGEDRRGARGSTEEKVIRGGTQGDCGGRKAPLGAIQETGQGAGEDTR